MEIFVTHATSPVNHNMFLVEQEPIDLGTILSQLDAGHYSTAHEVR